VRKQRLGRRNFQKAYMEQVVYISDGALQSSLGVLYFSDSSTVTRVTATLAVPT
jgi:hypothetical protein